MRVLQVCSRYQYFYNIWAQQGNPKLHFVPGHLCGYMETQAYQQWVEQMRTQRSNTQCDQAFQKAIEIRSEVWPSMQCPEG